MEHALAQITVPVPAFILGKRAPLRCRHVLEFLQQIYLHAVEEEYALPQIIVPALYHFMGQCVKIYGIQRIAMVKKHLLARCAVLMDSAFPTTLVFALADILEMNVQAMRAVGYLSIRPQFVVHTELVLDQAIVLVMMDIMVHLARPTCVSIKQLQVRWLAVRGVSALHQVAVFAVMGILGMIAAAFHALEHYPTTMHRAARTECVYLQIHVLVCKDILEIHVVNLLAMELPKQIRALAVTTVLV